MTEVGDGDTTWRFDTFVPDLELDLHLGARLPRHPPRAGGRARSRLLFDRCRARRRRRGPPDRRAGRDIGPVALRVPRRRRPRRHLRRPPPAAAPGWSTAPASSSTGPASAGAPAAPCTWPPSTRVSRPSTASRRSAGSCPSKWTGSQATTGPRVATVRGWTRRDWGAEGETMAWCCTEGTRAYVGDRPVVDVDGRGARGHRGPRGLRRAHQATERLIPPPHGPPPGIGDCDGHTRSVPTSRTDPSLTASPRPAPLPRPPWSRPSCPRRLRTPPRTGGAAAVVRTRSSRC